MTKYNARKTVIDGITFDSKAEARRYQELSLLEKAGEISNLRAHPKYVIWEGEIEGRLKQIVYFADFEYVENLQKVVEDVKGFKTRVYRIKKMMFRSMYPDIRFVEVKA